MYPLDFIQEMLHHYQELFINAAGDHKRRSFLRREVNRYKTLLRNS